MKAIYILWLCLCFSLATNAQQITHRFDNVTMPEALSWLDKKSNDITINFIYDELEDFKVTTDVKNKSIPAAIQSLIGFYPIKATVTTVNGDGTTLPKDYHHTYISVECTQKTTYHYKGVVVDNHHQPLPYANIILLDAQDSTYLNGGVSNESGVFVVPSDAKKVIAKISYVGFKTLLKVCMDGKVGNITLMPANRNLNAVVVKGEKPMVIYHGDRLVADIKGSILSKGNDGESLLQQLPGVWAENGDISINGKSGTKVYVGDRLVQLSGNNLATYLKGIHSENIDKVEIIAHPSAEYDAEGQGGIIRILLKQNEDQGTALNIGSTFGLSQRHAITPNADFSYHKDKWSVDVSANGTAWSKSKDNSFNHVVLRDKSITYDTPSANENHHRSANLNVSVGYAISPKDELLCSGNLSIDKSRKENNASTSIGFSEIKEKVLFKSSSASLPETTADSISRTNMLLNQNIHNKVFALSANYTHRFDPEGRRNIKVMTDFVRQYSYGNAQDYHYTNYDKDGKETSKEYLGQNIPSDYWIYSYEGRYNHSTLSSGQWTMGGKFSFTYMSNGLNYHNENGKQIDNIGYDYTYFESLYALYVKYQISKKTWDLTMGLRSECFVPSYLESKSREDHFWPYFKMDIQGKIDFFPSIYYTKRFSDLHSLSLSFSRRTQRPNYRNLLPERYHESRYEITEGNPKIRPDYPNELAMTYILKSKYMLGAEYTWSNNGFNTQLKSIMEDSIPTYVSTFTDGMRSRRLYFYLYAPITICKWWKMTFRPWGMYRSERTEDLNTKSFCYGIVGNLMLNLPHDYRFTLLYIAKSAIKNGNYEELATSNLHLTATKSFFHDHWTISLRAYNLFYKNALKMRYTTKDVFQTRKVAHSSPTISLGINYNFQWGKQKKRISIQHSNDEERSRL